MGHFYINDDGGTDRRADPTNDVFSLCAIRDAMDALDKALGNAINDVYISKLLRDSVQEISNAIEDAKSDSCFGMLLDEAAQVLEGGENIQGLAGVIDGKLCMVPVHDDDMAWVFDMSGKPDFKDNKKLQKLAADNGVAHCWLRRRIGDTWADSYTPSLSGLLSPEDAQFICDAINAYTPEAKE